MKRKTFVPLLILLLFLSAGCSLKDIPLLLHRDSNEGEDIVGNQEPDGGEKNNGDPLFPPEDTYPAVLYYLDKNGEYVVPLTRYLPKSETSIRESLTELISAPGLNDSLKKLGLQAPLPEGTEILGINLTGEGLLTIDLNGCFLDYPPASERQVISAIVYTAIQFDEVEAVEFRVDGSPLNSFPGGLQAAVPLFEEIGINLEVSEQVSDYENTIGIPLFFLIRPEPSGQTLIVPIVRVIPRQGDTVKNGINELLAGPQPGGSLFSAVPPETGLLGIEAEGDTITVNISNGVYNFAGGKTGEEILLQQLAATVMALDTDFGHMILQVEGEKPVFPHGTDAERPAALLPLNINEVKF